MGNYVPNTLKEQREILEFLGFESFQDLFKNIPSDVKIDSLNIPEGKSELEVSGIMRGLAEKNKVFSSIFRGAGAYYHYIPSIVKSVTSKEEFITSYTPYQAEMAQGLLQSIFEYQTMICEITGMDVSNASVYDGASAAAEAAAMCRDRRRTKVLVSGAAHPMVIQTIQTYATGCETEVVVIPEKDGLTDKSALKELLDDSVAAVYVAQPNFYGLIEDCEEITEITHQAGAKMVMGVNPISSALLKTAGECGADVAVGEGQPLGMPLSFGGPYLGFMTCKQDMMRKLPGRIVGETEDKQGRRGFVLTLQAREQHIRREKASSNLCTNQALCALTAGVYMTAMGAEGIREVGRQSSSKAHYAAKELGKIDGFALKYKGEFFNEFVTDCPIDSSKLMDFLEERDILGGLPIDGGILWCVTEMNSKEDIDALIKAVKEAVEKWS